MHEIQKAELLQALFLNFVQLWKPHPKRDDVSNMMLLTRWNSSHIRHPYLDVRITESKFLLRFSYIFECQLMEAKVAVWWYDQLQDCACNWSWSILLLSRCQKGAFLFILSIRASSRKTASYRIFFPFPFWRDLPCAKNVLMTDCSCENRIEITFN